MYTDEQIIQSLPPALQGDLKEFGALEAKTPEQLRAFLLAKREQYKLPPWHPFTLLIKRAALAVCDTYKITRDTSWYLTDWRFGEAEDTYSLDTADTDPVCYIRVSGANNRGSVTQADLAVQPTTKRLWKLDTERMCNKSQLYCNSETDPQECIKIPTKRVFAYAECALAKKQDHIVWEYRVRRRRVWGQKASAPVEELIAAGELSAAPKRPHKSQPHDPAAPVISEAQKEIIRTLLDMADVKATELNMHSTIVRWRHSLESVIGKESVNAESQS